MQQVLILYNSNLQVSHLEPVTVLVTGHGVLPQVSINQLKVSKPKIPIGWMYTAVASLTAKRFKHLISGRYTPDLTISNDTSLDWVFIEYTVSQKKLFLLTLSSIL